MSHKVTVRWSPSTDNPDGYNVYWKTPKTDYSKLTIIPVNGTSYIHGSPSFGDNIYSVRPVVNGVEGADSSPLTITVYPAALTNVTGDISNG